MSFPEGMNGRLYLTTSKSIFEKALSGSIMQKNASTNSVFVPSMQGVQEQFAAARTVMLHNAYRQSIAAGISYPTDAFFQHQRTPR